MARLDRTNPNILLDTRSLRLRAAWLYYNRGLTQKDIAENLGISRATVIRMLDEAVKRAEVQIWINETPEDCTGLALRLEEKLGLDEAIVVPGDGNVDETARDVGAALGTFLSEVIRDGNVVGVGWGRTLSASLQTFRPPRMEKAKIVSLLGGLVETSTLNPVDYSWRLASALGADCMLMLAPLIVDSEETKARLIERCGLDRLFATAEMLDIAVVSCGDFSAHGSSLSPGFLPPEDLTALLAAGTVCDTLCHFLDAAGNSVDHPLNRRVMSVGLSAVAKARHVVIASGGRKRVAAIRATMARTGCHTLITDEAAARGLLDMA
ncbi:LacI family transcriptional regulator [Rhizobium sp. Leaf384]|uniref:sugar-binding transcriptional regulator n=1 Tax=unclassified Rhizobium TaxID=2613769 RepID=UPI000713776D|nr:MULTISPECIES: sugar-binding transcriptional regulator [unclassified Rhizobium]KQS77077.1 LacI family transcriptional regulator [Rhizobium sp. Leaf384]KQS78348.1 LacI family transcriptional regulator [Rhizobium sp. Leaf383]